MYIGWNDNKGNGVWYVCFLIDFFSDGHCENGVIGGFCESLDSRTFLWIVSPSVEQLLDFGWAC